MSGENARNREDKLINRVKKLEGLLQELLDTEGLIRTSHNRKVIKQVLSEATIGDPIDASK